MTPKEKALELVKTFAKKSNNLKQRTDWNYDKQCALISVDEMLEVLTFDLGHDQTARKLIEYYEEIKTEIKKL